MEFKHYLCWNKSVLRSRKKWTKFDDDHTDLMRSSCECVQYICTFYETENKYQDLAH